MDYFIIYKIYPCEFSFDFILKMGCLNVWKSDQIRFYYQMTFTCLPPGVGVTEVPFIHFSVTVNPDASDA